MEKTGKEVWATGVPGCALLLKEHSPAKRSPGSKEAGPYTTLCQ